jgi:hypothetical protein
MALGIFDSCKDFVPNTKCILFSFLNAFLYWFYVYTNINFATLVTLTATALYAYTKYYECESITLTSFILTLIIYCAVISLTPRKSIVVLVSILYFSYLAQAWFDYIFKCQYGKLEPTILPFGRYIYLPFKDPDYKARYEAMCQEKKSLMDTVDFVSLLVLIGISLVAFTAFLLYTRA